MERLKIKIIAFLCCFSIVMCFAQSTTSTWNLDNCIQYALKNNISLKTENANIQRQQIIQKQTFYNHLPTLNAAATHGYNWGQRIDPFTNKFATKQVRTNNFFLSTSWTLFSGMKNLYKDQKAELQYQNTILTKKIKERKLKLDITSQYLQVVINYYALEISKEQLNYTLEQKKRIQKLVANGRSTPYDILKINAQISSDSLTLIKAQNELQYSKLLLKQSLNLKKDDPFEIDISKNLSINPNINSFAIENTLEFKQNKIQQNIQEKNLRLAKAKILPSLSLRASVGTGYSGNNINIVDKKIKAFSTQLNENLNQSAILTLNIPVFNSRNIATEIATSQIEIKKTNLQQQQIYLEQQNKIEQLYIDIENTLSQKNSAFRSLTSAQQAFEFATLRYEEFLISFTDYLETKRNFFKAQAEFLQAEFQHLFKSKILEYYLLSI